MPRIRRRQFLQFAGSTLATLGLSQLELYKASNRYGRVLAQSTPRKLALLVGINQYKDAPLQGCVTDVNLQQQLLIHRFGFNPKDILILTDEQATRQGILNAFEEHLIKQAKPGDVVVYHFSGHGSQVSDPDCDSSDCLNSTFVPIDSSLATGYTNQGGVVQDIMGHTLFLLMAALQTENVTVVLDSCHSGGGTRGNFRVRSRSGGSQLQPVDAEQAYQQQWLSKLNLSPDEFKQRRRQGIAKGVVIASTKRDQLAADAPFNDFFAGAFTYLMTQYLWQQTGNESFASAIANIARSTTRLSFTSQEPLMESKPGSNYPRSSVYFINEQTPPAEAVITKKIGLDPSLGNEASQAKQALTSIPRIEALPLQQQEVQYIFGRMTPAYQQQLPSTQTTKVPEVGSLGLFSPALELIPDSFGAKSEIITDAIARLRPKLQSLLAAHIVKTTLNTNSSRLNIVASMRPEGAGEVIASSFTIRGSLGSGTPVNRPTPVVPPNSQKLPLGTAVQLQVTNNEASQLYLSVLVIDPTGEMSVIFPNQWAAAEEVTLVAAGQTLKIPEPNKDSFSLVTQEPKGVSEVLILASRTPLRKALQSLRAVAAARGGQRGGPVTLEASGQLNEPAEVIDNLLDDVNNGNRGSVSNATRSSGTVRNIDTTQLAALSITFEVI